MTKGPSELFGLSANYIARICRVDLATARRWKRGATCPPHAAILLLTQDLGIFDPAWRGWTIRDGKLISPEGFQETPGAVRAIQFMQAQISTYRAENKHLKKLLDEATFLEEQPTVDSWEISIQTG